MKELEAAGWKKAPEKKSEDISHADIKVLFHLLTPVKNIMNLKRYR